MEVEHRCVSEYEHNFQDFLCFPGTFKEGLAEREREREREREGSLRWSITESRISRVDGAHWGDVVVSGGEGNFRILGKGEVKTARSGVDAYRNTEGEYGWREGSV